MGYVKLYWCTRCKEPVQKNARQMRANSKGWVCPVCKTGLPPHPMSIIEETVTPTEVLIQALKD